MLGSAESGGRDSGGHPWPTGDWGAGDGRRRAEIGHVTRLTTGKDGRSVAEVRQDEDVYVIPVGELHARDGAAFTTVTLDQLKRDGAAH